MLQHTTKPLLMLPNFEENILIITALPGIMKKRGSQKQHRHHCEGGERHTLRGRKTWTG